MMPAILSPQKNGGKYMFFHLYRQTIYLAITSQHLANTSQNCFKSMSIMYLQKD